MEIAVDGKALAVAAKRQLGAKGVIAKEGVARRLVQGGDQPEFFALAEITVALAVGDALSVGVIHEVIVAVAVNAEVLHALFRQGAQRADPVIIAILRAPGPALKAVHEDLLSCGAVQTHGGRDRAQRPVQGQGNVRLALFGPARAEIALSVMQLDPIVQLRHAFYSFSTVNSVYYIRTLPPGQEKSAGNALIPRRKSGAGSKWPLYRGRKASSSRLTAWLARLALMR